MVKLSLPAIKQVLYLTGVNTPKEEAEMTDKIQKSASRYDHSGRGELTIKEWFNVIKIQNKVDISLEKLTKICEHLPRNKAGKIKISDFINLPILSEETFQAIDR